jgi:hypothetical protein
MLNVYCSIVNGRLSMKRDILEKLSFMRTLMLGPGSAARADFNKSMPNMTENKYRGFIEH